VKQCMHDAPVQSLDGADGKRIRSASTHSRPPLSRSSWKGRSLARLSWLLRGQPFNDD